MSYPSYNNVRKEDFEGLQARVAELEERIEILEEYMKIIGWPSDAAPEPEWDGGAA